MSFVEVPAAIEAPEAVGRMILLDVIFDEWSLTRKERQTQKQWVTTQSEIDPLFLCLPFLSRHSVWTLREMVEQRHKQVRAEGTKSCGVWMSLANVAKQQKNLT